MSAWDILVLSGVGYVAIGALMFVLAIEPGDDPLPAIGLGCFWPAVWLFIVVASFVALCREMRDQWRQWF